ncbi:hypothetical protein D3C81_2032170 [compost metagenome]
MAKTGRKLPELFGTVQTEAAKQQPAVAQQMLVHQFFQFIEHRQQVSVRIGRFHQQRQAPPLRQQWPNGKSHSNSHDWPPVITR